MDPPIAQRNGGGGGHGRRQPRCSLCPSIDSLVVDPTTPDAVATAAALLHDCGVVALSRVHDADTVDALRRATAAHISSAHAGRFQFKSQWFGHDKHVDPRQEYLLPFAPPFNDTDVFLAPIVVRVLCRYLFGVKQLQRFYLEHSFVIRARGGGNEAQALHHDNRFPGVVAQVPVAPVTRAHGPTVLHPCTHGDQGARSALDVNGEGVEFTVGEHRDDFAPLGSVLLYESSLWHFGSANSEQEDRDVLFFHFCRAGKKEPRPAVAAEDDQRAWRRHGFSRDDDEVDGGGRHDEL